MSIFQNAFNKKDFSFVSQKIFKSSEKKITTSKVELGFQDKVGKKKVKPNNTAEFTTGIMHKIQKSLYYQGDIKFICDKYNPLLKLEIILIHGTFSPDAVEAGWTNVVSPINIALGERYHGNIIAMMWSGKNHRQARIDAGVALADRIHLNTSKGIKTNIIAHSHGGNVAFECIRRLSFGSINELITLGTPIRDDHQITEKLIMNRTCGYLHVYGGKDTVVPVGGVDFVYPGRGITTSKMNFSLSANRENPLSDTEICIYDATHSELNQAPVINLFGNISFAGNRNTAF